jgi:hypothetical protein
MKIFIGIFVAVVLLTPVSNTNAYGGGFGFPPGYLGSPVQIQCHYEHRSVGYRTILVRKCEAVQDIEFKDRVRAFVERLRHGGYDN